MFLKLYRNDLKPEFKDVSCRETKFGMFKKNVQQTMLLVDEQPVFYESYRWNSYNAIVRPKTMIQPLMTEVEDDEL